MSFIELLSWSVWEMLRPRKLLTIALVGLAGPMLALLLRFKMNSEIYQPQAAYGMTVPLGVYNFTLVLLAVVFASGIVSSEMIGKTIQFLLTRPTPRWKILLAKWLAAMIVVSVASILSCTLTAMITHGPAKIGNSNLPRDVLILPIGALTYCSLFALFSVLSTKPWIFAISFGFLWESWVPLVPGDLQKLSIMAHLRALSPQAGVAKGPHDLVEILKAFSSTAITPATAWNTLAIINILALAIACVLFMSSEFVPKDETA